MRALDLELQVGVQALRHRLADAEAPEVLQVGQAVEEQDALDQPVGVLHLADRFLVDLLAETLEAPVIQHARVQEVLVDGGELVLQELVELGDDLRIALHDEPPERAFVLNTLCRARCN